MPVALARAQNRYADSVHEPRLRSSTRGAGSQPPPPSYTMVEATKSWMACARRAGSECCSDSLAAASARIGVASPKIASSRV